MGALRGLLLTSRSPRPPARSRCSASWPPGSQGNLSMAWQEGGQPHSHSHTLTLSLTPASVHAHSHPCTLTPHVCPTGTFTHVHTFAHSHPRARAPSPPQWAPASCCQAPCNFCSSPILGVSGWWVGLLGSTRSVFPGTTRPPGGPAGPVTRQAPCWLGGPSGPMWESPQLWKPGACGPRSLHVAGLWLCSPPV